MPLELVVGAALGTVFSELLRVVIQQALLVTKFKSELKNLKTTLESIQPNFYKTLELRKVLNRPEEEDTFTSYLKDATELVRKCSRVHVLNLNARRNYTKKLKSLDNQLVRFFQINVQAEMIITGMESLIEILGLKNKLVASSTQRVFGWCNVPGLPEHIVGLDVHLKELKYRLLKDDIKTLLITAPGGCGKTTLAKKFCHDDKIKDTFGENILYVTVSRESSLIIIAQNIFKHYGENDHVFQSEEDAKNQIENLMKQKMGSGKMLLVLDDVWSESESLVRNLKFQIQGYKILVTSRFQFKSFDSTYELTLLNEEDAKKLLCKYAFPSDGTTVRVPKDLVNEMVKFCKGFPLALIVVGASLYEQPLKKWNITLKKKSQGRSVLESDESIMHCLKKSIDTFDEIPNAKECFMDLGSFPEDHRIPDTVLMDMWVELYDLDDEDDASDYLLKLSMRNLINLIPKRKHVGELDEYDSEYDITQHDLLRELAICQSAKGGELERKRLFQEIKKNVFPEWWTKQGEKPIDTCFMSITTDETFNSNWHELHAPNVKVLILNTRSENYILPKFIETMSQLKVLIVTGYGVYPTHLHNLQVLGSLTNIKIIRFEHVSVSSSIQVIFSLKNLQKLAFVTCKIGNALDSGTTGSPNMLSKLAEFEIDRCYDLNKLPSQLCSFFHLQKLTITNCHELDDLPEELGRLTQLQTLRLHSCTKLEELPESIGSLLNLKLLDISDCLNIKVLPEQISHLSSLTTIKMCGCRGLRSLPESLSKLLKVDVICDEEMSVLWNNLISDVSNVKINLVEEDRLGSFKIITQS